MLTVKVHLSFYILIKWNNSGVNTNATLVLRKMQEGKYTNKGGGLSGT